jgi:D-tyrosyl-tRNA(Tyr) deacylase
MKLVIQRVREAQVTVAGSAVGRIGLGVLVFVGITQSDTPLEATWLASKLITLRLFEDEQSKLNLSLLDRQGSALIVSQFTLYADCTEGRRPSFTRAAPSALAQPLYEHFVAEVRKGGIPVETGTFGAHMQVSLVNDGPVTLILERSLCGD